MHCNYLYKFSNCFALWIVLFWADKLLLGDVTMRERKNINIQIGANIQNARERAGLTQDKLSELLGVTPNHISAIERGVYGISLENLQKLCLALHVSSDSIIFSENPFDAQEATIAHKIALLPPKYKDQVLKGISALLEIAEMKQ